MAAVKGVGGSGRKQVSRLLCRKHTVAVLVSASLQLPIFLLHQEEKLNFKTTANNKTHENKAAECSKNGTNWIRRNDSIKKVNYGPTLDLLIMRFEYC